jgi:hypothetical protein
MVETTGATNVASAEPSPENHDWEVVGMVNI